MPTLSGTIVIAPVVPTSTDDVYPSHYATYGKGSLRTVADSAERDSIPPERLEEGCLVYVVDVDKYYKRVGLGWVEFTTGGGGGGDKNYVHVQSVAATTWVIDHNLGKYPAISLKDNAGNMFTADVNHISTNQAEVYLLQAEAGVAFAN